MSDFLEGGNHTDQVEQTEVTPNQVEQSPEGGQENTNVSEYDVIKYNKEEAKIPVDKRQDYLQMGYHYEQKVKGELENLQKENAYLDRMAKLSGFDNREAFFEALEQREREAEIERQAERLGVTPEAYEQFLAPVNNELSSVKSKLEQYEQAEMNRQVESEVMNLRNQYSDFAQHEEAVFDLAIQKGYSLEDSYVLVTHATKLENAKLEAQQQAIQSLQAKQTNSVGSLNGGDGGHRTSVSQLSKSDFQKMKEGVLRGDIKNL